MRVYQIGLIGYGGFGRFLHQAWSQSERLHVAAVADADPQRDPGGVRFYQRWQELVQDPEIDVVSVATPPATHAEMACAAMEAGKHVLVEKPLATSLEDARRIAAVRDRTRRVAAVDYMLRFNPIVETLQHWSRNGCFGHLRRVVVENYAQDEALPPEHWFWDPEQSGGILVEHAVHFIDVVNGCTASRPVHVDGLAVRRNERQEDRMMATVVYEDGLVATHYHAFSRPGFFEHTSMRFVFDLAQVEIEGWIPLSGRIAALVNPETAGEPARMPGFTEARRRDRSQVPDASRPEGWGEVGDGRSGAHRLYSGGVPYDVTTLVEGTFALPLSKSEAYQAALRAVMEDLVKAVEDPHHLLRTPLEEGLTSLAVAVEATRLGREQARGLSEIR